MLTFIYFFFFFFFKQKTAYEIRPCDWSSDVCSSDLAFDGAVVRDHPEAASRRGAAERPDRNEVRAAHVPGEERRKDLQRAPPCDVRDGHEPVESDFRDGPRRG